MVRYENDAAFVFRCWGSVMLWRQCLMMRVFFDVVVFHQFLFIFIIFLFTVNLFLLCLFVVVFVINGY